jgi:hypothetical protein
VGAVYCGEGGRLRRNEMIGRDLGDLPLVTGVCAGSVVGQRFGTGEFMVG